MVLRLFYPEDGEIKVLRNMNSAVFIKKTLSKCSIMSRILKLTGPGFRLEFREAKDASQLAKSCPL
jgi:hypothetical protein